MIDHMISLLGCRLSDRPTPFSIVQFVTNRCNARCSHCFIDFNTPLDQQQELTLDEICRMTKNLGKSLYNVNLTGGEPFLREDLFEIVKCYLDNSNIRSIVITTNGWFCDRIIDFVEKYSCLQTNCSITISISVDDLEQKHDEGRKLPGLYARVMKSYKAVMACNDRRIKADIALTVTEKNAAGIIGIYNDLRNKGILSISPVLIRAGGVQMQPVARHLLAETYQKLTLMTDSLYAKQKTRLTPALHRAKNRVSHAIIHDLCQYPRYISPCHAGTLFANIGADGTVAPCELMLQTLQMGNLRDHDMDFQQLWNSKEAREIREHIQQSKCHCTFECAWTVNILATPAYWPRLALQTMRELI